MSYLFIHWHRRIRRLDPLVGPVHGLPDFLQAQPLPAVQVHVRDVQAGLAEFRVRGWRESAVFLLSIVAIEVAAMASIAASAEAGHEGQVAGMEDGRIVFLHAGHMRKRRIGMRQVVGFTSERPARASAWRMSRDTPRLLLERRSRLQRFAA